MHLNMRQPNPILKSYIPLPFLRPSSSPSPTPSSSPSPSPPLSKVQTHTQTQTLSHPPTRTTPLKPTIIPSIPPTTNPRGELIFSSRVDRSFREGYERYRAAFERRREEKAREYRSNVRYWWNGRRREKETEGRSVTPTPPISRRSTPPIVVHEPTEGGRGGGTGENRRERTPSPLGKERESGGG